MTPPLDRRQLLAGAAATLALQPTLAAGPTRLPRALRVGLVGCGRQGREMVTELATFPDVELAAVCDTDESRLNGMRRRARSAQRFATVEELLEKGNVDAVFIATSSHQHRGPALAALAAQKPVYCEAPLATDTEDARAIAVAARGAGVAFQVGLLGRVNPVYKLAWSFVKGGAIRDFVSLRGQHHEKNSWVVPTDDGARAAELGWRLDPARSLGLIGELGAHQLDVWHWYVGAYPTSVRARGAVRGWKDGRTMHDTVQAAYTFPDGLECVWDGTITNTYGGRYELIHGTMGAVKLAWTHGWLFKESDAPTQGWEVYANRQTFHNDEGITLIADATKLAAQGKLTEGVGLPQSALWYGIESFLKCVTDGGQAAVGADEGFRNVVVATAGAKALRTGEAVAITDAMLKVD
ncbi:MAG: Gfo/Idh/MocA family oxidoreductase [Planctomycetota bacterium]